MAMKTYHAKAENLGNLQVQVSARKFSLLIDEPEQNGGENKGMSPVEMLLGSIGACQAVTAKIYAEFYQIPVESLSVEVEGEMDPDGFSGADPAVRPGFQKIRSVFRIKSSAPKAQLAQLIKMVEKRCPVGDCVGHGTVLEAPVLDLE